MAFRRRRGGGRRRRGFVRKGKRFKMGRKRRVRPLRIGYRM